MTQWNPGPGDPNQYQPYQQYPPPPPVEGYTVAPQVYPPTVDPPTVDPLISADFGGWWNKGISIVKRGWKPLVALQAVGLVLTILFEAPIQAYSALVTDDFTQQLNDRTNPESVDFGPLLGLLGFGLGAILLSVVVAAVITLASVHIGVSVAVGAPPRVGDAIGLAVRRILPLIGWQLLAIPIYIAAVCLCVLPVFYIAAVFLVLPVVVAVERTNAISRCFSLFHNNLGTSASRAATIIGITIGAAIVGGLIGSGLDVAMRSTTPGNNGIIVGSVATTLVTGVISAAIAVFVAPLTLAAYADLRARREPTNGLMIAQELGISPSTITQWPPSNPTGYAMPPA